jgi:steroid 5-alpha reductase family enzyme
MGALLSAGLVEGLSAVTDLWPQGIALSAPAVSFLVTAAAFSLLWLKSLADRDCGVVDLYWGFGFGVIAWIEHARAASPGWAENLLLALVSLWALRLGVHLVRRHVGATEEDARYRRMREKGGPRWPLTSFLWIFMLQAIVMWLIASPLHVAFTARGEPWSQALVLLGSALFAVGFVVESLADGAIARFRDDPRNRGKLLTSGLFAWSRHPNYFGETVLWWGFGLIGLGISGSALALAGPLLLTLLLLKVSGIPPLEEHLSSRPGFAEYAARTSAFIPLPPRRESGGDTLGRPSVPEQV